MADSGRVGEVSIWGAVVEEARFLYKVQAGYWYHSELRSGEADAVFPVNQH